MSNMQMKCTSLQLTPYMNCTVFSITCCKKIWMQQKVGELFMFNIECTMLLNGWICLHGVLD